MSYKINHANPAKKHLSHFMPLLAYFYANDRKEISILAVLATESFFRPFFHRYMEYLYWFINDIFGTAKTDFISVGIAQIQIRHWKTLGIISSNESRFSKLLKFINPLINYDLCKKYLSDQKTNIQTDEKLLKIYTGNTTNYHAFVFKYFSNRLSKI